MIFNTIDEVIRYIDENEPENLDGHHVAGDLLDTMVNHANNARKGWWPSCDCFGYIEEYHMGEGESMEINSNGIIINSSVYF